MVNTVSKAEEYKNTFERLMKDVMVLSDKKGRECYFTKDELFIQCYDPDDSIRKELPAYWFCNNKGDVISVVRGKPVLLMQYMKREYKAYHFNVYDENGTKLQNKKISVHNLVAICFERTFGKAKSRLEEDGFDAFSTRDNGNCLSGHHINVDPTDNDVDNVIIIDNDVHNFLHSVKITDDETLDSEQKDKFASIMKDEKVKYGLLTVSEDGRSVKNLDKPLSLVDFFKRHEDSFKKSGGTYNVVASIDEVNELFNYLAEKKDMCFELIV